MNELKIFENPEFGAIRTITENGKTLFCGTDIATALGYTNPRKAVRDHTRGGTKRSIGVQTGKKSDGTPAMQMVEMLFIPEGDVYRLIAHSKLPSAERFESWVFDDVLPTIRKTGGYIPVTPEMSEMEILSRAVLICKRTIDEQEKQIAFEQSKNVQLSKELAQARPAAQFALECLDSPALFTTEQIAKDYGLSARALNQKLNLFGVQYKRSGQWLLYARYADQGLTHSRTKEIKHSDGSVEYKMYTCWTAKGRKFIHELLRTHSVVYSQPLTEIFD